MTAIVDVLREMFGGRFRDEIQIGSSDESILREWRIGADDVERVCLFS